MFLWYFCTLISAYVILEWYILYMHNFNGGHCAFGNWHFLNFVILPSICVGWCIGCNSLKGIVNAMQCNCYKARTQVDLLLNTKCNCMLILWSLFYCIKYNCLIKLFNALIFQGVILQAYEDVIWKLSASICVSLHFSVLYASVYQATYLISTIWMSRDNIIK